jgi:hypothetical protein
LYLECSGTVAATSATKTVAFVWGGGSLNQQIVQYTTVNTGTWQFNVSIWNTGRPFKLGAAVCGRIGRGNDRAEDRGIRFAGRVVIDDFLKTVGP